MAIARQVITIVVMGRVWGAALQLLLKQQDLTFVIRDAALWETTLEEAERVIVTRAYPVADLIRLPGGQYDYDSLIQLVTSLVAPESWDGVGGPGSIDGIFGALVVSQSEPTHYGLAILLDRLRRLKPALNEDDGGDANSIPTETLFVEERATTDLRKVLSRKVEFDFVDVPLWEVADYFRALLEIPILLDVRALDDSGLPADVPVSSQAGKIAVRDGLTRILRPHGLRWVFSNEVLLITTSEWETPFSIRIYPVADLVGEDPGWNTSLGRLIEIVQTMAAPTSWGQVGGPAAIDAWQYPNALIIDQTEHGHEEVVAVLTELRKARQAESKLQQPGAKVDASAPIIRQVYELKTPLSKEDSEQLVKLIVSTIEPESWEEKNTILAQVADRWVIHTRPQVHQQIQQLLQEMTLTNPPQRGGFGGGGHDSGGFGGGGGFGGSFGPGSGYEEGAFPN